MAAVREGALDFIVPLLPFERILVDDLVRSVSIAPVDGNRDAQHRLNDTFWKWKWPNYVKRCLSDDLGGDALQKDYRGNRFKACDACLHFIAHNGKEQNNLYRVAGLRQANEGFIERLGDQDIEDIHVRPADEDLERWIAVADIDQTFHPNWYHEDFLQSRRSGEFEFFEWTRKCALALSRPDNATIIDSLLVLHPNFRAIFEVGAEELPEINSPHFETLTTRHVCPIRAIKRRPRPSVTSQIGRPDAGLKLELKKLAGAATPALEHPGKYVPYIPWHDLELVDNDDLISAGISRDDPFTASVPNQQYGSWSPPRSGLLWNHHLYIEDEVFDFNVRTSWSFPDHYKDAKVIFSVRPVEDTDFIVTIADFWELWNDCAVTQQSPGTPLLLLETLPGQRYRSRNRRQDRLAALTYFRNLTEAKYWNRSPTQYLAKVLGSSAKATDLLRYENSLRYIEESQLHDISWSEPLGRGANGAVYAATWHLPEPYLATNRRQPRIMNVVLKEVLPRAGSREDRVAKVLKELDTTYTGIGGQSTACVKFYGVTSISRTPEGPPLTLLVFERATCGPILNFLASHFEKSSFVESFSLLVDAISSVGNGISSLHKHHILHRDLHPGNILVTDHYYESDPIEHEFSYIITDLGEGKDLSQSSVQASNADHWASYGAVDYRAPEVNGSAGWSTKAEVFSFAVIAMKILDCRRFTCKSPPPDWVLQQLETTLPLIRSDSELQAQIVPYALMEILEPCLDLDPNQRQEMHPVVLELDDLSMDFFSEDPNRFDDPDLPVEWTVWKWNAIRARSGGRSGIRAVEKASVTSTNVLVEVAEREPDPFDCLD